MIDRPAYLNKLVALTQADSIVVITGVRRCGKSTLLDLYAQHLEEQGVDPRRILRINFESSLHDDLRTSGPLHRYVGERVERAADERHYLLVDEVQEIDEWAKTLNSLRASFPLSICVTGSNSRLFAGEGLTYLSGRYVELKMYPLSLAEFDRFALAYSDAQTLAGERPVSVPEQASFEEYLSMGSFPAVALARVTEVKQALLQGIVDSVMVRDVVNRGRIENEAAFRRVAQFVFDNIGSFNSARSIANTLTSSGRKVSINTVDRYLGLLCDAFVLYRCPRYDIKGKEYLTTNPKYYVVDTGLRNTFLGERQRDLGHVLENLVYLELLRRGYDIAVGRIGSKEVDFVASKHGKRVYVQVSQTLADPATADREFSALLAVGDAYPKYVMSMDELDYSSQGVVHMRIQDFLRGEEL